MSASLQAAVTRRRAARHFTRAAQFQAVLSTAALVQTAHFALHGVTAAALDGTRSAALFAGGGAWLGLVLPKRWARRAVTRSTLKRQICAVEREYPLPAGAWVVRLKRAFPVADFPSATSAALRRAVRTELRQLLGERLQRQLAAGADGSAPPRAVP